MLKYVRSLVNQGCGSSTVAIPKAVARLWNKNGVRKLQVIYDDKADCLKISPLREDDPLSSKQRNGEVL